MNESDVSAVLGGPFMPTISYDIRRYKILEKIGQGTFGDVFKARDKFQDNINVAIKFLNHEAAMMNPELVNRELSVLQNLQHENIVKLIDIWLVNDESLGDSDKLVGRLVFEFCKHDLFGLLASPAVNFSPGEMKNLIQQLLTGLNYIHARNYLHRDIKPSNILVTHEGVLKIADFGLAACYDEGMTSCSLTVVSLWYRPPELLLGKTDYDASVDMWSAGCVIAEILTRRVLFQGDCEEEQLRLISKLCGSITFKVWPEMAWLNKNRKFNLVQGYYRVLRKTLYTLFPDKSACKLVDKLLILNPVWRYNAMSALRYRYFAEDPPIRDLRPTMSTFRKSFFRYKPLTHKDPMYRRYLSDRGPRSRPNIDDGPSPVQDLDSPRRSDTDSDRF